jgi:hypothetical protein
VRGEAVAQRMRAHVLGDPGGPGSFDDHAVKLLGTDRLEVVLAGEQLLIATEM